MVPTATRTDGRTDGLHNNCVKNRETDAVKRSICLTTLVKRYNLILLVWEGNRGLNPTMNRNRLVLKWTWLNIVVIGLLILNSYSVVSRLCGHYCACFCILRSSGVGMLRYFTCDTGVNDVVVHGLFCKIINA